MSPYAQVNRGEHKVGRKTGETSKLQDQLPQENAASGDIAIYHGGVTPSQDKGNASG